MRYLAKRALVSCAIALVAVAAGSVPVQANLLDPTGTDVTSLFPTGIVDSSANSSWIYLVGAGGASGRVSATDGTLDTNWRTRSLSVFEKGWPHQMLELSDWNGLADVEVDSRGRILEHGWIGDGQGGEPSVRYYLTRTLSNGDTDLSFATDGIRMMRGFGSSESFSWPGRLGLDSRNRIYESVSWTLRPNRTRHPLTKYKVFRLLPNGEVDRSYGSEGSTVFAKDPTMVQRMRVFDMAVDDSGRTALLIKDGRAGAFVRALDAEGKPDRSFNKATRWVGLAGGKVKPISVDFDRSGDLTVAVAKRGSDAGVVIDRVKPDGSPRKSFGKDGRLPITDGWLRRNLGSRSPSITKSSELAAGLTVDSKRRTVLTVSGEMSMVGAQNAFSIRVLPNGELDQGFGEGGFFLRLSPLYPKTDVMPITTLPSGAAIVSNGTGTSSASSEKSISLYELR